MEDTLQLRTVVNGPKRGMMGALRPRPTLWLAISSLPYLWARRHLLVNLTVRSVRAQYKQSVLGYAWLFLNPLTQLATLTFVFTAIFKSRGDDDPFVLFLAVGLYTWNFFASATTHATESVVSSARMIGAVYFPREFLVLSAILVRLVDFAMTLVIILVAFVVAGQELTWTFAWAPLIFLLQFLFMLGLALPLAALNLFFHDVRYLLGVVLHLWFFFTPIFYSLDDVPERFRPLYELNPMARFIGAYREALLDNGSPASTGILLGLIAACVSLAAGYYIFRRMEPRFADRV
jgi:ABC-2 type transport system permease protein